MVSAVPVSSVGSSGDPAQGGPGPWACVVSVGTMESSEVGESLKATCACPLGEPFRGMEGPSLQLCRHLPCTHACTHTNTYAYTLNARKQLTIHLHTCIHVPNSIQTHSVPNPHIHAVPKPHTCTHVGLCEQACNTISQDVNMPILCTHSHAYTYFLPMPVIVT